MESDEIGRKLSHIGPPKHGRRYGLVKSDFIMNNGIGRKESFSESKLLRHKYVDALIFRSRNPKMVKAISIIAPTLVLVSFSLLIISNTQNASQVMGGNGTGRDISDLSSQVPTDAPSPATADAGTTTFSTVSGSLTGSSSSFAIVSLFSRAVAKRRGSVWEEESACGTKVRHLPYSTFVSTMASARRDQLGIILDILALTEQPIYMKKILYQGNLSYFQLKRYLRYLLDRGFITEKSGSPKVYMITRKGRDLTVMLTQSV